MRIVLLSGGSGKRLWPLSNEVRSKIFLKVLQTPDGGRESMIQRICRQLDSAGLLSSTIIVTHQDQIEITKNHIGTGIPIISEPHKRGTFPAVALAAAHLNQTSSADPGEVIVVIPSDQFVDDEFIGLFHTIPGILSQSQAELVLIGTPPTHPSDQYGYIVPAVAGETDFQDIIQFAEKPEQQKAARLIEQKALWNCGVFAFPLSLMLGRLLEKGLPMEPDALLQRYEQFPELSFDREITEQTRRSVVIPYKGQWRDLGSWETLSAHLDRRILGWGKISDDSSNTHLVNELSIPVHIIGVPDVIVAASPDGILIAEKKSSSRIKSELGSTFLKPRCSERRWGHSRQLDHSVQGKNLITRTVKVELFAGKNISYHLHRQRKEIWTVLTGTGTCLLDGQLVPAQAGDVIQIPCGVKHSIKAETPLALIEVQMGVNVVEEDIERLAMSWKEALQWGRS